MSRFIPTLALLLWCPSLLAQESVCLFQKCYGTGLVLITSTTPSTGGTVEMAVRNTLCPEGVTPPDDPLAGKLVFRSVALAPSGWPPVVPVTVVMHNAEKYTMGKPFEATFSGPATAHIGFMRRGIKGTLEVTVADWRDPTDALGPSIMLFDTVKMIFIPELSFLPHQLEWQGVVWRGDLVVFERWGR